MVYKDYVNMAERQVFGTDLNKQGRLIPTPLLREATICYGHDKKDFVVNWDSNLGSNRIEQLAQEHARSLSFTRVSFGKFLQEHVQLIVKTLSDLPSGKKDNE